MPIALCCLPGVAIAAIIGVGIAVGGAAVGASLGGPLGIGLIVLAALACPVSMGLMMRPRGSSQKAASNSSQLMADCCAPEEETPSERVAALRAQRESLERELAEMQALPSKGESLKWKPEG